MPGSTLTRRQRIRQQTVEEIKQHALQQIAEGGAATVSLNAIAKEMGMSGPAIYRYFTCRDELLGELVTAGYAELASTLEAAEAAAARRSPPRRLTAVAEAYRAWALAHPHRYAMLFGIRPPGFADPEEAISTIHGCMRVLLGVPGELSEDQRARRQTNRLDGELLQWVDARDGTTGASPLALRLGVLTWTRLHGIVSLELAGVFASMKIDAGLLVEAELRQIVDEATS